MRPTRTVAAFIPSMSAASSDENPRERRQNDGGTLFGRSSRRPWITTARASINDALYVGGQDGNLHVFRRGGSATCCDAGGPSEGRWVAYLVYAAVIGGLGLLVLRRRGASRPPG